ncbi:hypothetical protein PVA44_02715 [Entomospira nematocerorum]|uniref:Lipoprotein n=1 Tax=Entomospira nematocerorum TaxID=2719987 RepID=A0A968GF38_9SPIO|nr:hypothetical protein [Entomospira nematocera]NIZ47053.1 hypothetical protein [Entomospira nematocera]WDI34402.1 hypothetical protein PVA44_02715 [Entomospira nematocera]
MFRKRFFILWIGLLTSCKPQIEIVEKINPVIITNIEIAATGPLDDVRIRGYIIPSEGFYLLKEQVKLQAFIKGVQQSHPLHFSYYELFLTFFSNHFKNGYDKDLLASYPKDNYNGGVISFNTDTYELIIEDEIVKFIPQNLQASIFLTKNKKWRLDATREYLRLNAETYEPEVGKQYYILWILEGRTHKNEMIVKIIGEQIHANSLYTITY